MVEDVAPRFGEIDGKMLILSQRFVNQHLGVMGGFQRIEQNREGLIVHPDLGDSPLGIAQTIRDNHRNRFTHVSHFVDGNGVLIQEPAGAEKDLPALSGDDLVDTLAPFSA